MCMECVHVIATWNKSVECDTFIITCYDELYWNLACISNYMLIRQVKTVSAENPKSLISLEFKIIFF